MMDLADSKKDTRRVSKFLSLILRHEPETIGIELDSAGWAKVDELLSGMASAGVEVSYQELVAVVETNDKQRFAFNEDRKRIRAVQGRSREVALGYEPIEPPRVLYHGTVARSLPSIREEGLRRGSRQCVHLSPDIKTASIVGARRGKPIILSIDARGMHSDGHQFFRADNGVWLTEHVPPRYIIGGL